MAIGDILRSATTGRILRSATTGRILRSGGATCTLSDDFDGTAGTLLDSAKWEYSSAIEDGIIKHDGSSNAEIVPNPPLVGATYGGFAMGKTAMGSTNHWIECRDQAAYGLGTGIQFYMFLRVDSATNSETNYPDGNYYIAQLLRSKGASTRRARIFKKIGSTWTQLAHQTPASSNFVLNDLLFWIDGSTLRFKSKSPNNWLNLSATDSTITTGNYTGFGCSIYSGQSPPVYSRAGYYCAGTGAHPLGYGF